jgi:tRNA G18 (ribose-2'-O)-methylase SpoU
VPLSRIIEPALPQIIDITDPDDPLIGAYRAVKERDLVGREGLFIAEGEVVVRVLARTPRHQMLSLLLAERQVDRLADLLASLPDGVPVYRAGQAVMDAIVGFPIHRGILGLGRRSAQTDAGQLLSGLGPDALVVGLSGLSNHDNVGGVFRNAAAFGVDAVVLDSDCCDPLYRKAIRVSVGGGLLVPFVQLTAGDDMVGLLQGQGFTTVALSPSGQVELAGCQRPVRCAVLFGAEGPGLSASVLERTLTVRLTMSGGFDSLNVATTSGIVLHHLTRA